MDKGFLIEQDLYTTAEVRHMVHVIDQFIGEERTDVNESPVFAIRRILQQIPELLPVLMKPSITTRIAEFFGKGYFISKSIYFDKPKASNWFVSYHQDVSISVEQRVDSVEYEGWTLKDGFFGVQPPEHILEDNFTLRLHLDHTDGSNGALRVLPYSHQRGIRREIPNEEAEIICPVSTGGVMWMRPLLFHASSRSLPDAGRRRVIHIEFSRQQLAAGLDCSEKIEYS